MSRAVVVLRRLADALLGLNLLHRVQVGDELAVVRVERLASRLQFAHDDGRLLLVPLRHQLLYLRRRLGHTLVQFRQAHCGEVGLERGTGQHLLDVRDFGVLGHQRLVRAEVDCLEQREPSSLLEWPSRDECGQSQGREQPVLLRAHRHEPRQRRLHLRHAPVEGLHRRVEERQREVRQ